MNEPYVPTPAIQQVIAAYVRAGGFIQVAVEAAGVPFEIFEEWFRQGESEQAETQESTVDGHDSPP